ncbi:DNA replication complex GINS protein PSF2-like protein [Dinothrombium tinctorium]|uniref:DNA replication complex GINS protein PSF2-like protein n=1 Tax=Dinothrombium tinctorium TaxID=1965070 RepID=A0A3S3S6M6_9ACAR|nr:DNA replication complex GINS protein PSF2-like protein [Dinothrombium tinctorium]
MDWCEFIAEEEIVEIIPNFKYDKQLNLISGDFGPFLPSVPVKVPLWLALNLQRQHKCTIVVPQWIQELQRLQEAQENSDTLIEMPSECWREIMHLFREQCKSMPNYSSLIEKRESILKSSVHALFRHAFESKSLFLTDVTLHNVSRGELQLLKSFVQKSFAQFQALRNVYVYSKQ